MEIKNSIAQTLREIRLQNLLTIKELSRKTGLSERYILKLEAGKHVPGIDKLFKISSAFGLNPKDVIEQIDLKIRS